MQLLLHVVLFKLLQCLDVFGSARLLLLEELHLRHVHPEMFEQLRYLPVSAQLLLICQLVPRFLLVLVEGLHYAFLELLLLELEQVLALRYQEARLLLRVHLLLRRVRHRCHWLLVVRDGAGGHCLMVQVLEVR